MDDSARDRRSRSMGSHKRTKEFGHQCGSRNTGGPDFMTHLSRACMETSGQTKLLRGKLAARGACRRWPLEGARYGILVTVPRADCRNPHDPRMSGRATLICLSPEFVSPAVSFSAAERGVGGWGVGGLFGGLVGCGGGGVGGLFGGGGGGGGVPRPLYPCPGRGLSNSPNITLTQGIACVRRRRCRGRSTLNSQPSQTEVAERCRKTARHKLS